MLRISRKSQFHIVVRYFRQARHYDFRELVKRVEVITNQIQNLPNAKLRLRPEELTEFINQHRDTLIHRRREIRKLIKLIVEEFPALRSYVPWL